MDKAIIFLCVKENEVDLLSTKLADLISDAEDYGARVIAMFAGTPAQAKEALDNLAELIDTDEEYFLITDSPVSFMNAFETDLEDAIAVVDALEETGAEVLYMDEGPEDLFEVMPSCECRMPSCKRMEERDWAYLQRQVEQILRAKLRGFLDDLGEDEALM